MTFEEALDLMLKGEKVKLPGWDGYWEWDDNQSTILMFTFEGKPIDIRATDRLLTTLSYFSKDDWELATNSNCLLLGGEETFSFSKGLEYLKRKFKIRRKSWEKSVCIEMLSNYDNDFLHPFIQKLSIDDQLKGINSKVMWFPNQDDIFANDWQIYKDGFD